MPVRNAARSLRRAIRCAGIAGVCAIGLAPIRAEAFPLRYEMTLDTVSAGKAVLLGDLDGAAWVQNAAINNLDDLSLTAKLAGGGDPQHWTSTIEIRRVRDWANPAVVEGYHVMRVDGRHVSNPPPHPGEASPGPALSQALASWFAFINGLLGPPVTLTPPAVVRPHEDHWDRMATTLLDLDPQRASVLAGAADEIRLNVDFAHLEELPPPVTTPPVTTPPVTTPPGGGTGAVPEPMTSALMLAGLTGLAMFRRGRGAAGVATDPSSAFDRRPG